MDQPSIDGVNTYFASLAAAQSGLKVALSGLGGDEIFGGYRDFRRIPALVSAVGPFRRPAALGRLSRRLCAGPLRRMFLLNMRVSWNTAARTAARTFLLGACFCLGKFRACLILI